MQVIEKSLSELLVGEPQAYRNLSVVPLLVRRGVAPDYVTLDEALERKLAEVTEVSESGSVPELAFENTSDTPVLLLDGEELVGAKQNRILNLTILAAARARLKIPVSCVEQGRWAYRKRSFGSAGRGVYGKLRAAKAQRVSENLRASESRAANQGEIWRDIDAKFAKLGAVSESRAMGDIYAQNDRRISDYVRAFSALPGQAGAVFAIDGVIVGLELFDAAGTFAKLLPKLVSSYAMDAIESRSGSAVPPVEEAVRRFIEEMKQGVAEQYPALGMGTDIRINGPALAGGALVVEDRVVHLAAFRVETPVRAR